MSGTELNKKVEHVDYDTLDRAKNAFIEASRRTLGFASKYGAVPSSALGASANLFEIPLSQFKGADSLSVALVPEGLGTADDARPEDLTSAELTRFWFNIGIKTVSVMTNDAASAGLQTVLIGLYLPSSEPEVVFTPEFMTGFLDGFVEGCKEVGCVYISGETPQLKTKIHPGKLDIAGALFALRPPGVPQVVSSNLKAGNFIVFVESSGPHENGFTTLRALADKLPKGYRTPIGEKKEGKDIVFWEAINAPSKLYTPLVQAVLEKGVVPTNIENITGHGWQKIMRASGNFEYVIEEMLPVTTVFKFAERYLEISPAKMIEIFNYGVGMTFFCSSLQDAECVVSCASKLSLNSKIVGKVRESHSRKVSVLPLGCVLSGEEFGLKK